MKNDNMQTVSENGFTYDENIFSDLHKDAYGFRPRDHEFYSANPKRKQQIWDETFKALRVTIDEEACRQDQAAQDFEKSIRSMMEKGASSRAMAIRWLIESTKPSKFDLGYGGSYMCYQFGLDYGSYQAELDAVIKAGITTVD